MKDISREDLDKALADVETASATIAIDTVPYNQVGVNAI